MGIYMGDTKPDINLYLEEFVSELSELIRSGVKLNETEKIVMIPPYFICDSPARCHLKGKKSFNLIVWIETIIVLHNINRYSVLQRVFGLHEMHDRWRIRQRRTTYDICHYGPIKAFVNKPIHRIIAKKPPF